MGEFSIELTEAGTPIGFEIQGNDETAEDATRESVRETRERIRQRMENLIVKYSPRDSLGNAMGVTMDMSRPSFDSYRVRFSTNEPPASVHLKIIPKVTEVEYPIELQNIPLKHHAEMPEALETLAFAGHDAPVTVEFLEIRKDPNSPEFMSDKVVVRVTNHSNKDAVSLMSLFVYLDGQGTELESFPNSFTGTYTQDGQKPVVEQGATTEVERIPGFMPDETKMVRIVVRSVGFIDGTMWRSQR